MIHSDFWNWTTKVGGTATRKSEPIPQFRDFHSIQKFITMAYTKQDVQDDFSLRLSPLKKGSLE